MNSQMVEKARDELIDRINAVFDTLTARLSGEPTADPPTEYTLRLKGDTNRFIGTKAVAVLFGDERVTVRNWRKAFEVILGCCNRERHDELMRLRNRTAGKVRTFLSDKPDGMTCPVRIDDDLWVEEHYGTGTLFHILCRRILDRAGFDYSNIRIAIRYK